MKVKTVQTVLEIARRCVITATENAPADLKTAITRRRIVPRVRLRYVRTHVAMPVKHVRIVLRIVHHSVTAATEFAALKKITLTVRWTATAMATGFSLRQIWSPEAPGLEALLAEPGIHVTAIM